MTASLSDLVKGERYRVLAGIDDEPKREIRSVIYRGVTSLLGRRWCVFEGDHYLALVEPRDIIEYERVERRFFL